ITDAAGGAFTLGYDAAGRQTSMTRPNGVVDTTVYGPAGDLTSLHSTLGPTIVNRADYTYDNVGLTASLTTTGGTATYGYDGAKQLTTATYPAGSGLAAE